MALVQLAYRGTRSGLCDPPKSSPAVFLYDSVLLNDANSLSHEI